MNELVEKFCTPPVLPITDFDKKVLSGSSSITIPFEGEDIRCYIRGEGKVIILAHGWGSRASHMALIGRQLAAAGFQIIMFDAPAHTSIENSKLKSKSNMFEYCRALYTVFEYFQPLHGIVAHSLGSLSTVFTAAGYLILSPYKVEADRIALLSTPSNLDVILHGFCEMHNLNDKYMELKLRLEQEFNFLVNDYSVPEAVKSIDSKLLFIHDEDDESIPVENAYEIQRGVPSAEIFITKGSGHDKILMNRQGISKVIEFMQK